MNESHAVITGANRGIGLGLVKAALADHCRVTALCRKPDLAEDLLALESDSEGRLKVGALDLGGSVSIERVASILAGEAVDILINNGAVQPEEVHGRFEDLDCGLYEETFRVNVMGTARMTQTLMPHLRRSRSPRVAMISSAMGSISSKDNFAFYCYAPSKAALNMLTRCLANELAPEGFTIASLSPGWVKTGMGGPMAEITIEESVQTLWPAIRDLNPDQNGQFLDRNGKPHPSGW